MSTDYYYVCDKCKQISDNALTLNMSGGYVLGEVISGFIEEHFFNVCPVDGIRIISEHDEICSEYLQV